jgi:hypothetical protein
VLSLNYDYMWRTLEALMLELRAKGVPIPGWLIEDLRAAKTFISIRKADPSAHITEAELYLEKVETALLQVAEEQLGKDAADSWLRRIEEARFREPEEDQKEGSRFIPGAPKDQPWVRIMIAEIISMEEAMAVAEGFGLSVKPQNGGFVLIYGPEESLRGFIRKLAERARRGK